jgi:hypothetical protein
MFSIIMPVWNRAGLVARAIDSVLAPGPAYRDLRKKIFHERQNLVRCTICPPSFKLSKSGWFPVVTDFTDSPLGHFKFSLKKHIRTSLGWKILSAVNRRLKKPFGDIISGTK